MAYKRVSEEEFMEWARRNPGAKGRINGQEVTMPIKPAEDLGTVGNIARGVLKPFRAVASMPEYLVQALAAANRGQTGMKPGEYKSIFLTPEEEVAWAKDPVKAAGKSVFGLSSFLIPGGGGGAATTAGRIGTAAGRGTVAGMVGGLGYSREGKELQDMLSGGITGGAVGATLQGASEAFRAIKTAGLEKKLKAYSDDLKVSALKKDIGAVPTTKQGKYNLVRDVVDMSEANNFKIRSADDLMAFSDDILSKNSQIANDAAAQLDSMGVMADIRPIKSSIMEKLSSVKQQELREPLQKVLDSIDNATQGADAMKVGDLLQLRREWGKLGNWNALMDPKATAVAGVWEDVYLNANDVLDDVFKQQGFSGFKDVNKSLKVAIESQNWAERAMANKRATPLWNDMTQDAAMFGQAVTGGPGGALAALGSKGLQRYGEAGLQKGVQAASKIAGGTSKIPQVLESLIGVGQRAIPAMTYRGDNIEMPEELQPVMQQPQQQQQNPEEAAMRQMLVQAVLSNQISATEAKAVLDLLGMGETSTKMTEAQRDYQLAAEAIEEAYAVLEQGGGAGKLATLGGNIAGFFNETSPSSIYRSKLDTATAFLRKALIGSGQSEAELKNLNLPKPTDEPEIAKEKILSLIPLLRARAGLQPY